MPTEQERIAVSMASFADWIIKVKGIQRDVKPGHLCIGPIQKTDEFHIVQKTGREDYTIHRIDQLCDTLPLPGVGQSVQIKYDVEGRGVVLNTGRYL
jgi:hypothetical protein